MRPSCAYFLAPSPKRGRAERRMRDASAASCAKCKKHTSESPRKHRNVRRSARDGLSACFVLSPAVRITMKAIVSGGPGARPVGRRRGPTGFRSGPHDLGRRARRYKWGASPPRSVPHSAVVHRVVRPHAPPASGRTLCTRRTSLRRARALATPHGATLPRPPHPAPRIVTIAKRPSRGAGRG